MRKKEVEIVIKYNISFITKYSETFVYSQRDIQIEDANEKWKLKKCHLQRQKKRKKKKTKHCGRMVGGRWKSRMWICWRSAPGKWISNNDPVAETGRGELMKFHIQHASSAWKPLIQRILYDIFNTSLAIRSLYSTEIWGRKLFSFQNFPSLLSNKPCESVMTTDNIT